MNVTIVGAGEVGRTLADYMLKRNHDVNIIDHEEDKCKIVAKEAEGAVVYRGNVLDEELLKHSGLESADVLVITPVDDDLALRISHIAKKTFGVPYIISMVDHDSNIDKFREQGVDVMISQTKSVLQSFESALDKARSETLHMSHEGDIKLVRVEIELDSEVIGWKVSDLKLPKECMLIYLNKKEYPVYIAAEHVIQAHEVFYLFGKSEQVENMRELMTRSGTS